jgi:hypothetical protein
VVEYGWSLAVLLAEITSSQPSVDPRKAYSREYLVHWDMQIYQDVYIQGN